MEYRKIVKVDFRDFTRDVLEKSWEWLNDPQIQMQTSTPALDRDSSEKWFNSLQTRDDYFIKSIWCNGKPIAVMGLKHLTKKDAEAFGYIGEKEYWGKSVGVQGLEYLIEQAKLFNLQSVYSVILKTNLSSYKLHWRLGFKFEDDKDEEKIIMRLLL